MNQERFVQVPSKVLESLLSMASAHVEDINSGIEEGIYSELCSNCTRLFPS